MTIKFPSDEWAKALMEELNRSQSYAEAAKNWEGDFYFIILPDQGGEPVHMYMDLWHGKAREAFVADDPSVKNPAFRMTAPARTWRKVIEKQLDPIQGLLTRQLQLTGNLGMIMKNVRAAQELVNCTTQVSTEFVE
jgi:putative sterol carrier protein